MNELQKQTNTNIQEKANLIWESATHLVGLFKPHEYGKVILPLTVLKRFDDALAPTKQAVLDMKKKLDATNANEQLIEGALTRTSGYAFYNTSKFVLLTEKKKEFNILSDSASSSEQFWGDKKIGDTYRTYEVNVRRLCFIISACAGAYYKNNPALFNFFDFKVVDLDERYRMLRGINND